MVRLYSCSIESKVWTANMIFDSEANVITVSVFMAGNGL